MYCLLLLLGPLLSYYLIRRALAGEQEKSLCSIDYEDVVGIDRTARVDRALENISLIPDSSLAITRNQHSRDFDNDISTSNGMSVSAKLIISILWWLSLLSYLTALAMPFNLLGDSFGGGVGALLMGWFYLPFWLPNPMYFCGMIYLKKQSWNKAGLYALGAVAISGYCIVTNDVVDRATFLEHSGLIAFVWFGSFCLLLFACLCAWATLPPSSQFTLPTDRTTAKHVT